MDEIFCVKQHNYPTRNQNLVYSNDLGQILGLLAMGLQPMGTTHFKYGTLYHKKLKLPRILQPLKALSLNITKMFVNAIYANFISQI